MLKFLIRRVERLEVEVPLSAGETPEQALAGWLESGEPPDSSEGVSDEYYLVLENGQTNEIFPDYSEDGDGDVEYDPMDRVGPDPKPESD